MQPQVVSLWLVVVACASATESSEPVPNTDEDATHDVATGERVSPWQPTSRRFEICRFGYWQGASKFEARRSDMTTAQLAALDGLRTLPARIADATADLVSYSLEIEDDDGEVGRYLALEGNSPFIQAPGPEFQALDIDSLEPFLALIDCLSSKLSTRWNSTTLSDALEPIVSTEQIGCYHGLSLPYGCDGTVLQLKVETPGAYTLTTEGSCYFAMQFEVLPPDGSEPLALASGEAELCPVLTHTFPEPGTYPLRWSKVAGDACQPGGDSFFFNVSPANR